MEFSSDSSVAYGTCIIEGLEGEKNITLWMRQYDDDQSNYSINFTGSLDSAGEILGYLVGNDKMMQLLVRPL